MKRSTKGATIQREIASVYTTIPHVEKFTTPDTTVQFISAPSLDDGVCLAENELSGHTMPGSFSIDLFFDPANAVHQLFQDDIDAGGVFANYKINYPGGGTEVVVGCPEKAPRDLQVKAFMKCSIPMKARGASTWTDPS